MTRRRLGGLSLFRGWIVLGRYISCDILLRVYMFFSSWSHSHRGPINKKVLGARKLARRIIMLFHSGKVGT
jgi:hypothetical protein